MSELEAHTIPREISNGEDVHAMKSEQDVRLMLHLKSQGSSTYEIARLLNCSRTTVRRYLRLGGWQPAKSRGSKLSGLERWLEECFERHAGNADVIHQHLRQEWDLAVSLRTVQRAVRPLRRRLRASRMATVRFETAPGKQVQVDFGTRRVLIGGVLQQVHVLVATLGYSRRQFVAAYGHEMQAAWLDGMERAFQHFGGVPRTVLMDNPKALVSEPRRGNQCAGLSGSGAGLCSVLALRTARLRSLPCAHQGQGGTQRWLRQEQCSGGSHLRRMGGARPALAELAAECGRPSHPQGVRRVPRDTLRARTPDPNAGR